MIRKVQIELLYGPNYPEWLNARPMADCLVVEWDVHWDMSPTGFLLLRDADLKQQVWIPPQYVQLITEDYEEV